MTPDQKKWILSIAAQAYNANHIYPRMAACEAALESDYGTSQLAQKAKNLFGLKVHRHNVYGVLSLPTKEFIAGEWLATKADWESYPTFADCFADRMQTLMRLRDVYPEYQAALTANDAVTYIQAVSWRWSTDPNRGQKVLDIFNEVFPAQVPNNSEAVNDAATGEN